jgi:hypothetical protein
MISVQATEMMVRFEYLFRTKKISHVWLQTAIPVEQQQGFDDVFVLLVHETDWMILKKSSASNKEVGDVVVRRKCEKGGR